MMKNYKMSWRLAACCFGAVIGACYSFEVHAQQVKILFDATKAEMVTNADWVIDADVHDLGDNSSGNMVVGYGNESDPQRYPTPAQSGVTANTSETYWEGSLSAWAIDCVKKGYEVETLPYNGSITYKNSSNPQDLSNYTIFVVDEPNLLFTSSEKAAIVNFVKDGGRLFMISDHNQSDRNNSGADSPHVWNDLLSNNSVQNNPFGITFDYANFSQTTYNVSSNPNDSIVNGPMGSGTEMMYANGTSMTLSTSANSSVVGDVFETGASNTGTTKVMMAHAFYGKGRVAALGDSSPPDDGTGDPNDNLYNGWTQDANGNHEKLIMNATIWLATDAVFTGVNEPVLNSEANGGFDIYPNPGASNKINCSYSLNKSANIAFKIYNVLGQEVYNVPVKVQKPGNHVIKLDNATSLSTGVYLDQLIVNGKSYTKKMIINN